jgi:hypothetical protein
MIQTIFQPWGLDGGAAVLFAEKALETLTGFSLESLQNFLLGEE